MSVLYLSYDGLMEQLGQSQVLPYLKALAPGRRITLMSYEKSADLDDRTRRERFSALASDAGIRWIPLRYHKRPAGVSTVYDLAVGFLVAAYQCARGRGRIVHARGYVPSVLALGLKRLFDVRFIFDMRGFWVDQRVEMGVWRRDSAIYRVGRWFETRFLQRADVVFLLTTAAVNAMRNWPAVAGREVHFEVVTTCTDLELFHLPPIAEREHRNGTFTLGYVGNAGAGYLFEPVLDFFLALRALRPGARLTIVNRNDHPAILAHMKTRGLSSDIVTLAGCDHDEVPARMQQMDAGVFFVRPDPSRISSVPTRMGEFLASGVPCVGNAGVADVVEVLEGEGVGVALRDFEPSSFAIAARAILDLEVTTGIRRRCADVAARRFSLAAGVATYERVYQELERAVS